MPAILGPTGHVARQITYKREEDFEADVVRLADHVFGSTSLYLDIKRRIGSDILTIPDGYLIDTAEPDSPKLFVVENEIVSHDPFRHIGIQMLKFVTSFEDSQRALRTFLMDSARRNPKLMQRLETACKQSSSPNIDNYLDRAVYGAFRGVVVIDEARPELFRVLEKINANISVLEFKCFETETGERLYQFETLYDEFEEETPEPEVSRRAGLSPVARAGRRLRRAGSDTVIVPAREEGFQEVFLGENQWYAIRIGAAMKDRIKYIAAYRVAPISAVTHIAEVAEIKPYKDTGKYLVLFKGPASEIKSIGIMEPKNAPQGPMYVRRDRLLSAPNIEAALTE